MALKRVPIQAVVWDLDDTLFPERAYVRSGYRAVAEHLRRRSGTSEAYERWLWMRFLGGQAAGAFDALSEAFRLDLTDAQRAELVTLYREHIPTIQPFGDVPYVLSRLHGRYRLGLLSDGTLPGQANKLAALGLERFFDAICFTESLGRDAWKPSPVGYQHLHRELGIPHAAFAYVADNPAKDFLAPNKLGWRTVQWLRPGQVHAANPAPPNGAPQCIVRSAGELHMAML